MKKGILLTALGLASMSTQMFGGVLIDFGGAIGGGGTITVSSGGTVTGTNIAIGDINVEGDGALSGIYSLTDGLLNFSFSGNPSTGATSITITGTVGTCTNNGPGTCVTGTALSTAVSGTLLTGISPDSFSYTIESGPAIDVTASGPDTKSATLLSALGLTGTSWNFGGFSIGGTFDGTEDGLSTYTATSTDIGNNAVPEPTSILLLGTVLFGVTRLIRRRIA